MIKIVVQLTLAFVAIGGIFSSPGHEFRWTAPWATPIWQLCVFMLAFVEIVQSIRESVKLSFHRRAEAESTEARSDRAVNIDLVALRRKLGGGLTTPASEGPSPAASTEQRLDAQDATFRNEAIYFYSGCLLAVFSFIILLVSLARGDPAVRTASLAGVSLGLIVSCFALVGAEQKLGAIEDAL